MNNQTDAQNVPTDLAEQDCILWVKKNRPDLNPTSPMTVFKAGYSAAETRFYAFKAMSTDVIISSLEDDLTEKTILASTLQVQLANEGKLRKELEAKLAEANQTILNLQSSVDASHSGHHDSVVKLNVAVEALEKLKEQSCNCGKCASNDEPYLCTQCEALKKISEGV